MSKTAISDNDLEAIADYLYETSKDPELFVRLSYPWGEPGTDLEHMAGPEQWQHEVMQEIKDDLSSGKKVIRIATASGNGIGKSALVSWMIQWGLSTRVDTRVVVTANTDTQLKTKTWAELSKWFRMWIAKDIFEYTASGLFSRDEGHRENWKADAIPWNASNPESFAGLHNQGKRILIIFDEASGIDQIIWETIEGALSDDNTEIIFLAFGNPTRTDGGFYDCFHKQRKYWHCHRVDSRTVSFTNKEQLAQWVDVYGEDSDFVKVHVRGDFPSASEDSFISRQLVDMARAKVIKPGAYDFAPIIIGVDPSWKGKDDMVAYLRQGLYCKRIMRISRNDNDVDAAAQIAYLEDQYKADAVFIDEGYGQGIFSAGQKWGREWTLVNFGSSPANKLYANKRAEMWGMMRQWLLDGGAIVKDDQELADDLVAPKLVGEDAGKIQLESKKAMKARNIPSPNCGDALALTFAHPVMSKQERMIEEMYLSSHDDEEYDPFKDI